MRRFGTPGLGLLLACAAGAGLLSCGEKKQIQPSPGGGHPSPLVERKQAAVGPLHPDILFLQDAKKRGSNAFREMREKLSALPEELSPQDAEALMAMLKETPKESDWIRVTWAAFVNDSFNRLRSLKKIPDSLVKGMDELNADPHAPDVLRDYALQHLGGLAADRSLGRPDRQIIAACLERNRREILSTRCGTALNASENLLTQGAGVAPTAFEQAGLCDRRTLTDDCLFVLREPGSCEHGKISALGVLSRLSNAEGVNQARHLLASPAEPVLVKAAALAYLAPYANDADRDICRSLSLSSDRRLAVPARRVLKTAPFVNTVKTQR